MVKYENHCCDCATPGYPCMGAICPLTHVEVHYCDGCDPRCEDPLDEIYDVDGDELCEECLKERFRRSK